MFRTAIVFFLFGIVYYTRPFLLRKDEEKKDTVSKQRSMKVACVIFGLGRGDMHFVHKDTCLKSL
jgi:hypothetical protein